MYYLFLDDQRDPGAWYDDRSVVVARNYAQFVHTIEVLGWPLHISFDYDLGPGPTGADCAKWLIQRVQISQSWPTHFGWCVHSQNPVGAANIRGHMKHFDRFLEFVR